MTFIFAAASHLDFMYPNTHQIRQDTGVFSLISRRVLVRGAIPMVFGTDNCGRRIDPVLDRKYGDCHLFLYDQTQSFFKNRSCRRVSHESSGWNESAICLPYSTATMP